jgi:hypothetical protein
LSWAIATQARIRLTQNSDSNPDMAVLLARVFKISSLSMNTFPANETASSIPI